MNAGCAMERVGEKATALNIEFQAMLKELAKYMIDACVEETKAAGSALKAVAGGGADGTSWGDTCQDINDWDILFEHCKLHLCDIDGVMLDGAIRDMQKARRSVVAQS